MRKVLSVAMAASGLLVSGSSLAALDLSQPEKPFWEWSPSVVIAIAGAIIALAGAVATSVAAIAAWRATKHSKQQADIVAKQEMRNQLESHRRGFFDDLERLEKRFALEFVRAPELYRRLFPGNNAPGVNFSYQGDHQFLSEIQDEYLRLCNEANERAPGFRYDRWAHYVNVLAARCGVDPFVYQGAFRELYDKAIITIKQSNPNLNPEWQMEYSGMPTGFSMLSCSTVFYNLYNAINHLLAISGEEQRIKGHFVSKEFTERLFERIVLMQRHQMNNQGMA